MSTLGDEASIPGTIGTQYRTRSYQLEMLEHSKKRNIIVAMDTGSGKTHIAVLRIMCALEENDPDKLVWFLGTTVALCTQQHEVLSTHLPAARIRLLLGSDNVDRWSEKRIWDAALKDIDVVVSTHAILSDALIHGFVTMARLKLLVFDEAHHCVRRHPANKIMQDFYHPTKNEGRSVPAILGLTASPIKNSKRQELSTIEGNLDSISITPRLHRQELLKHVHRPHLAPLRYPEYNADLHICASLVLPKLRSLCQQEHIMIDLITNVDGLILQPQHMMVLHPQDTYLSREKFCVDQLKKFYTKAQHIYDELGQWASDYFIIESVRNFLKTVDIQRGIFEEWQSSEKGYMRRVLAQLDIGSTEIGIPLQLSPKLECLISYLSSKKGPDFSGLLFVQQRATASILSALLSAHPETKNHFRCAPYVGLSNSGKRKQNIGELLDPQAMCDTLADFKERRKNLIISTEVLEEGIDVTACNMVICFDKIPTLKSFIQRRGRARQEKSTYAIMLGSNDASSKIDYFQQLEAEMNIIYQDEERLQTEASAYEDVLEDVTEVYIVELSQARITGDSSISHIHHFCSKLRHEPFVDLRPTFNISEYEKTGLLQATLILPSCVSSTVRCTSGTGWWRTEHAARKDAALQAYKALHKAGLLSDYLLPFPRQTRVMEDSASKISPIIEVRAQFDPWDGIAKAWAKSEFRRITIAIEQQIEAETRVTRLIVTTPLALPDIRPFTLYWNGNTAPTVTVETWDSMTRIDSSSIEIMRDITHVLIRAVHSDQVQDLQKDYVALITPEIEICNLQKWVKMNKGRRIALEQFRHDNKDSCLGFLRPSLRDGTPHIFYRWRPAPTDIHKVDDMELEIECVPLTKRRNFLRPATLSNMQRPGDAPDTKEPTSSGIHVFPADSCTIDLLPSEQAQVGLLIPSILQHFEVNMIALQLRQTLLKDIPFSNIDSVVEAITASSAHWITDYQWYEFLGDSILKFAVSYQLFLKYPTWHEGYLSARRASLVSNNCLAEAALDAGLDAFIITKRLGPRKWNIPRISDAERWLQGSRSISSKILADVVEALIGAAYLEAGLPAAIKCMQIFSIGIGDQQLENSLNQLLQIGSKKWLQEAERLVGYQFRNKGLLQEALTHPSYEKDVSSESYQRLEFLGDAVLDMILVEIFAKNKNKLSHGDMTMIKAALVNAELLAFFCLESRLPYDIINIQEQEKGQFQEVPTHGETALWKFMRFHSTEIMVAEQACLVRYRDRQEEISRIIKSGKSYPWHLLAQLNADKFFSDIIESIIGAIFVDSGGSIRECQCFVERIGLIPYLYRILAENIDTIHPKTALGHLVGSARIEYNIQRGDDMRGLFRCAIKIEDVEVVKAEDIVGCLTKDEAMVQAADAALRLLST